MRVALGIEYDGSLFHGWQYQPRLRTVQDELERAIGYVANHDITLQCAGRTDTGVHALAQVVHFDTDSERTAYAWLSGTNSYLPKDITVRWVRFVDDDFHARFSAVARRYRYFIYNHAVRSSVAMTGVTWQYRPLNHELMQEAAACLVGEHDFSSFRAIECQAKTPVRRIIDFTVKRQDDLVILDVKANAFLHHMVRNLAGVLMAVGVGRRDRGWVQTLLAAKNRALGAETAPPCGLYLVDVEYPASYDFPAAPLGPLFYRE